MWIGSIEFDILLGDVRSLKQKRSVVRPLISGLQRRFSVSAAETGWLDLHRRAGVGVDLPVAGMSDGVMAFARRVQARERGWAAVLPFVNVVKFASSG